MKCDKGCCLGTNVTFYHVFVWDYIFQTPVTVYDNPDLDCNIISLLFSKTMIYFQFQVHRMTQSSVCSDF